ncbi:hypothetical protein HB364_08725 [Pseudoflavitalea sp. X16]|uniref:hypothetical protein n=1 Tax=Paraflavitalea devenefica TaxID=2716334 RepID=UPI001420AC22|nr:hypothetical protein [Paraflavitalea devenefica]NII25161.1 hypothetical protein [Paraflavitalea devenefica]
MSRKDKEEMDLIINSFYHPSKKSLFKRMAGGDKAAFDHYYDMYINNTYRAVRHLPRLDDETFLTVTDVTAEVFADACRQKALFNFPKVAEAFLFLTTLKLTAIHLERLGRHDRIRQLQKIIQL